MNARQSFRLPSLVLSATPCVLLTRWVLTLSSLRSLGAPCETRAVQTDTPEIGAAATLFGGGSQNGPCDMQIVDVVVDLADDSEAAIVSVDGGAPRAVRAGKSLSSSIRLVEIKARSVVVERNGTRQEIPLPVSAMTGTSPANYNTPAMPLSPAGVTAPLSTPAMPPAPSVTNNPASTAMPGVMLPITPVQINTGDEPVSQGGDVVGPRHRAVATARKGDTPQLGADQQACHA